VIDDEMGDEVKVTVIAAGFDRWDGAPKSAPAQPVETKPVSTLKDLFADDAVESLDDDDEFDVPSFLK
jgi:cell division protein FtsZ